MATVYEIMNQLSNIRCEMREQIALLTLNRPEALNALNSKTLEELDLIFESGEYGGYSGRHHHRRRQSLCGGGGHRTDEGL